MRLVFQHLILLSLLGVLAGTASPAAAQPPAPDGAAVFARACANCHAEGQTTAPTPTTLRALSAESILNALTNGRMQQQGSALAADERRAVALFTAGRGPRDTIAATTAIDNTCKAAAPMGDAATSPG